MVREFDKLSKDLAALIIEAHKLLDGGDLLNFVIEVGDLQDRIRLLKQTLHAHQASQASLEEAGGLSKGCCGCKYHK